MWGVAECWEGAIVVKALWPLDHQVIIRNRVEAAKDVFGNVMAGWGPDKPLRVFGWAEPSQEELVTAENAGRVVWDIDLFAPSGTVLITDQVVIDGQAYEVTKVGNFDHGPKGWLTPGLEVIHLKKTEG